MILSCCHLILINYVFGGPGEGNIAFRRWSPEVVLLSARNNGRPSAPLNSMSISGCPSSPAIQMLCGSAINWGSRIAFGGDLCMMSTKDTYNLYPGHHSLANFSCCLRSGLPIPSFAIVKLGAQIRIQWLELMKILWANIIISFQRTLFGRLKKLMVVSR